MSTVLHPVGPQPPRVYWVRRLIVVGVVLVVVVLVAVAVRGVLSRAGSSPGAGEPVATEQPDEGVATGPVACPTGSLTLTVTAEATSYPAPQLPVLGVGVSNTGEVECTVDISLAARGVLVMSGSDRIWSSGDCAGEPAESLVLLAPGARQDVPVTWPRVRSDAACTADLPEPRPGTYNATVEAFGVTSAAFSFQLS